jgi:hypothetical protein
VVGSGAEAPAGKTAAASQVSCMSVRYGATPVTGLAHCASLLVLSRPVVTAELFIARTCSTPSSASWIAACLALCRLVAVALDTKNEISAVITMPISASDTTISIRVKPSSSECCARAATGSLLAGDVGARRDERLHGQRERDAAGERPVILGRDRVRDGDQHRARLHPL